MGTAPNGFQTPKTDWQASDVVTANDFTRIEGNIQAIEEGQRTIDPAQFPSGNVGTLRQLLDWFANRIKVITGKTNWWDTPTKSLEQLNTELSAHLAEKASDEKLGHVAVDGESIITNDAGVIFAHPIIDGTQHKPQMAISTLFQMHSASYNGFVYAIAVDDNYVYVGGTDSQTVRKLNKSNLTLVAESSNQGTSIDSIAVDNNYVYVGGGSTTSRTVKKLNKSTLSKVAESADYGNIGIIALDDNYVYLGGRNSVKKLNKSDLKLVAESETYGTSRAIAVDDNYVYVGWGSTLRKLNKSNLKLVAEYTNYDGNIYAIAVDGNYVYMGGTAYTVKKLNKSNLSQVAESANYGGTIEAIVVGGNYVYVGERGTQTVKVLNKSNLSQVAESANYGGSVYAVAVDNNYVYVGGGSPQPVRKLVHTILIGYKEVT